MLDINSNLATVCLKEFTHFGPESVAMAAKIKREWLPRVTVFLKDMFEEAFDLVEEIYYPLKAEAVVRRHELEMTEGFVSAVGQTIGEYAELAFEDAAFDTTLKFKESKIAKLSVLERLSQVTGASQVNVGRTVNRWFKTTHGMYFSRFIMPYTEKLTAMRESQGKKATLYDIGQKYKKFAQADGYWDSITDFNAATASVFGQVEAMFALGYQGLIVEAQLDRNCCPVCQGMDGATWPIHEARAQMYDMLIMGAEEAAQAFPWPRAVTGKQPHRLPPYHLRCFAEGTEVFTKRGWVDFKEATLKDKYLSRKADGELEWVNAVKTISYPYNGDMVCLKNHSFDLSVTPDHNQPYERRSYTGKSNRSYEYFLEPINSMLTYSEWKIPRTGYWNGFLFEVPYFIKCSSLEFCEFMGYYLSEGSVTEVNRNTKYQIKITQSNQENKLVIHKLLSKIFALDKRWVAKESIYILNDDLAKYLLQFGKSKDKYVPSIIKDAPLDHISMFLDAYILGDGSITLNSWEDKRLLEGRFVSVHTSSLRMVNDISELIVKAGGYPNFSISKRAGAPINDRKKGKIYYTNNDCHLIHFNRTKYATHQSIKVSYEPYNGIVRDVELERNHVLLVRYKGKTTFSGNCRCITQPISIGADSKMLPKDVRNLKDKVLGIMGASNTRVVRHAEGCVNKVQKAYDQSCIRYEMGLLRDNQRKYEGESAIRDVLGLGALKFTNSRSPVDIRTGRSAIDVYTIRNRSDRVPGGSTKGKISYCETHNLQPWTMVLVEGEAMSYEVYAYEGFDVDEVEDMVFLGEISREQGETESGEAFDDYFRGFLGEDL